MTKLVVPRFLWEEIFLAVTWRTDAVDRPARIFTAVSRAAFREVGTSRHPRGPIKSPLKPR